MKEQYGSGKPPAETDILKILNELVGAVKASHWLPEFSKAVLTELQALNTTAQGIAANTTKLETIAAKLDAIATNTEKLDAIVTNTAKLEAIATNTAHLEVLKTLGDAAPALVAGAKAAVTSIETTLTEVGTELGAISQAILGKGGYNKPTYKRTLRAGESLSILDVPNVQDPGVRAARKAVKVAVDAELTALLKGVTLKEHLAKTVGAEEALNAVKAAFIDRPNLDQTTRLLLTTENVVELEFVGIVAKGSPSFWDTQATVEAIRLKLRERAKTLFKALVKGYAKERGWDATAATRIENKLVERYQSLS
jgi:hypothetical protein